MISFLFAMACLSDFTVEEKVGQLLMPHFHGECANEEAKTLIQEVHVGSIIYYNWSNGLTSPVQVKTLSAGLQKLAQQTRHKTPLLIAADQEGGVVARLTQGFTIFPGNKAVAMSGDLTLAKKSAYIMGKELLAVGVNMNLAPDVDVNNTDNPVIGIRAFSDELGSVVTYGEQVLQGYRDAQVITCLKHFPGYGDVTVDPHEDLPVLKKTKDELEKLELVPFCKLAPLADTMMTAHLLIPHLDPDHCSTVSKKTLSLIRSLVHFDGVVVSDSLVMEGVLKMCGTVDEAAIQALRAGCDLLILGGKQLIGNNANLELTVSDVKRVHSSIVEAVKTGRITMERLDEAAARVLKLKEKYLTANMPDHFSQINSEEHRAVAKQVASLAMRCIKKDHTCLENLHEKKVVLFAPELVKEAVNNSALTRMGKETETIFFAGLNPQIPEVRPADLYVVCGYNAWKNPLQKQLMAEVLATGKPVIFIALRDPVDATLFPEAHMIFTTFSPTLPSIQAVCAALRLI